MSTEPSPDGSPPPPTTGLAGLLRPSTLAPIELDLRRVFLAGVAIWGVALVVAVVLMVMDLVSVRALAICGTGLVLGLLALGWEHRRRRRSGGKPLV